MLDKEVFNKGIQLLTTEYGDRGFKMTKEKAAQWYEYMKKFNNAEFMEKIDNCLKQCGRVPFMADIMQLPKTDTPIRKFKLV